VIACQDQNKIRLSVPEECPILENRVSRTAKSLAARRTKAEHRFIAVFVEGAAASQSPYVRMERLTLILSENADTRDAGVEAVGKRKVDQAVDTTKGHCRLGAAASKRQKTFTLASSQYECLRPWQHLWRCFHLFQTSA
jgi:hypothetical protein